MLNGSRSGPIIAIFGVVVALVAAVAAVLMVHNANSRTLDGRSLNAQERHGAEVFARTCAGCHSLTASNATGHIGPSLDYVQPTAQQVRSVVAKGSQGAYGVMPPGLLHGTDVQAVAAYLVKVADRKNIN
jgi:mono/diheme cytochrome c family protein